MENELEGALRKKFEVFHSVNHYNYSCNMTQIAKDLGISRLKLYRWLGGEAHLNESQLDYITKFLGGLQR